MRKHSLIACDCDAGGLAGIFRELFDAAGGTELSDASGFSDGRCAVFPARTTAVRFGNGANPSVSNGVGLAADDVANGSDECDHWNRSKLKRSGLDLRMETEEHIGQRLLTVYDDLPRGERRLADVLLEDLGSIRYSSAGDLAKRSGVSKATASRLFQRLGYSGFRAILREVRDMEVGVSPAPPDNPLGDVPLSIGAYLDAEIQHLIRTFEVLRPDDLNRAVQLLLCGEKLWVVGFGEDYPSAHFARSLLIKLRPDIRMIPIGGFPIPEEFASISEKDTVLALGVGRRTQDFRNVIRSASEKGAGIVLVTGNLARGDRSSATVILRGRTAGPTLFESLTATTSLLTYLCARLASELGFPAAHRLRAIASIHAEWDEGEERDG